MRELPPTPGTASPPPWNCGRNPHRTFPVQIPEVLAVSLVLSRLWEDRTLPVTLICHHHPVLSQARTGDTLPAAHCLSLCCKSRALIVSKLSAHTRRYPCEEVLGRGAGKREGAGAARLPPPPSSQHIQQPAGKPGSAGKGQRAQPWEGQRWRAAEALPPVPAAPGVLGKGSPSPSSGTDPPSADTRGPLEPRGLCRALSPPMAPGDPGDLLQPPAVPSLGTSPHPSCSFPRQNFYFTAFPLFNIPVSSPYSSSFPLWFPFPLFKAF